MPLAVTTAAMNPPAAPPTASSTSTSPAARSPPYPPPNFHQAAQAAATATAALSQDHTPTPNHVAAGNGRKRKPSGAPGSRSVSSLTPDQLAKKRANDREAQRAIRERTKNTIDSLEQRIRELESQQPFQDLQRVIQERDRALAECEELRGRLSAVAGIVGGQHPRLNELASLTAQQSPLPPVSHSQQQPQTYPTHSQPQGPPSYEPQYIHPDLRTPGSANATSQSSPASQTATPGAQSTGDAVTLRKWSPSLGHSANNHGPQTYPTTASSSGHLNGDRLGLNFLLESSHQQQRTNSSPSAVSHQSPVTKDQPLYARLTNVGPPSCPLDSLLIDFEKSRRRMLRDGASELEAIGPSYPAFDSMLDPATHPRPHPVSALLIDILSKFPDIHRLAEKVAVLHIMFLVLRWQISPTAENYNSLPPWCRPVAEQLDRPHVQWCDYLPWPHMRRQLAIADKHVDFEDFFVPYTTTLDLNWNLPEDCVLLPMPSRDSDGTTTTALQMNPAFEHHLRKLENWSLGNKFRTTFPHLVDESVRISA